MRRGFMLLFATCGLSYSSDTPSVPNGELISAAAPIQDAINHIRQDKPIPEKIQKQVAGLPAETIHGCLGKPEVEMGEDWVYFDKASLHYFSFRVKQGRVESVGYYHWW